MTRGIRAFARAGIALDLACKAMISAEVQIEGQRHELDAIRVALSQICDDGDPLIATDAQRKLATEILARHEAV